MREVHGNLWDWIKLQAKIVVPVNIGWTSTGAAVMGAGVAKQAAHRYPKFLAWWGAECQRRKTSVSVKQCPDTPLIAFPTKPFNGAAPHLSWQSPADLWLVETSLDELALMPDEGPVALPLVGCGNGGLPEPDVLRLLHIYLKADRFVLVRHAVPGVQRKRVK